MGIVSDACSDEVVELAFGSFPALDGPELAAVIQAILYVVAREVLREREDAAVVVEMLLEQERERWEARVRGVSES